VTRGDILAGTAGCELRLARLFTANDREPTGLPASYQRFEIVNLVVAQCETGNNRECLKVGHCRGGALTSSSEFRTHAGHRGPYPAPIKTSHTSPRRSSPTTSPTSSGSACYDAAREDRKPKGAHFGAEAPKPSSCANNSSNSTTDVAETQPGYPSGPLSGPDSCPNHTL
jgi:hypothetical protein